MSDDIKAMKRLLKEWKTYEKEKPEDMFLCPISDSELFEWFAVVNGPKDTPYEGGKFQIKLSVPSNYPLSPPKATFVCHVFHPNVHFKTGDICLDVLNTAWSPIHTLQSVCRTIVSLLTQPEPDSPLNCDAGNLLRSGDIRGYNSLAKMYTKLFAK